MHPEKNDSWQPKRATNIDGFFGQAGNDRPRRPVFMNAPGYTQPEPDTLNDMPRRANPMTAQAASSAAPASIGLPLEQTGRRRRGPDQQGEQPTRPKRSKRSIAKRIGMVFGVLVVLAGVWFGLKFYNDIANLTGNKNPFSLLGAFHPVPLQNQDGRVNILIAGNSADDKGHNGAQLTDSIMVLSVDTKNNTAMMLSIPRDLWVNIPGVGYSKINAAYPNGGMNKLQQVVQRTLGLPIDYHVLVNYTAFRDLVNAVGGITITIKSNDPRGIYDPSLDYQSRHCCALAKYPNGPVNLNGQQALDLARARGDAYGSYGFPQADFDRTMHQRQMLMAIKDKASQSSVIANPLKVTSLLDAVGNNIKTDLQVSEIETLYTYMKKINDNNIDSYNINTLKGSSTPMLTGYTTSDGQSALIPAAGVNDFSDIQAQIRKLFSSDPLAKEGATVVILNGTQVTGLAQRQEYILARKGMSVSLGNAPAQQATTTLIDNSGGDMPHTLAYLKQQYKATVVTSRTLTYAYPSADFILILGQSAAPASSTTSTGQ